MLECIRFKEHPKGALVGFADFKLDKMGIELKGCSLYQKNGKRWVNMPSKAVEEDGETKWYPYIRFIDDEVFKKFKEEAPKAIERFCQEQAPSIEQESKDGLPF